MSAVIGIDPGTHTGIAIWDALEQRFKLVTSLPVHRALELVGSHLQRLPLIPVIFEDARLRNWFGKMDAEQLKYGNAVREGAGAAKRDASLWEDYLEDKGCPYLPRKPSAGSSKWSADSFKRVTGWTERTNEHARDAGVLVFGYTIADVANVKVIWERTRADQATHSQASWR